MSLVRHQTRWARMWVSIAAGLFIVALIVSAVVVPQLRFLHVLQALIYVGIIILSRRGSAWGFGAAVTVAVAWNSLNLFVTRLMQAGAVELWRLVSTGQTHRLDTAMVFVGGLAHFLLIGASLVAFEQSRPGRRERAQFVGGGVLVLAYLAAIIAIAAPR